MTARARTAERIASEVDPDLADVKRFILDKIAQGAFAVLIASVLALLVSMRDLTTELRRRLDASRRARPPSETLRRLQMELPFWGTKPGNDTESNHGDGITPAPEKKPKKRGPKNPHPHGRPKLPAHLERVPDERRVPQSQCICPNCHVDAAHVTFKLCEKLELRPARFIVVKQMTEVVACQRCHEYVVSAPRPDDRQAKLSTLTTTRSRAPTQSARRRPRRRRPRSRCWRRSTSSPHPPRP